MTQEMPTITRTQAIDALQHEYMTEIRSLAVEAVKEHFDFERQEPEDDDALTQWLEETIDGHEWIIYTWKARLVLCLTDSPDAYEEDFGEPAPKVEAAAYAAMLADVRDMLGNSYFLDEECKRLAALQGPL